MACPSASTQQNCQRYQHATSYQGFQYARISEHRKRPLQLALDTHHLKTRDVMPDKDSADIVEAGTTSSLRTKAWRSETLREQCLK